MSGAAGGRASGAAVTLCLAGDVMTGRGVDQILPAPGDARLWEGHVVDARRYVELAERASGTIPRPVPMSWPWGDALPLLDAKSSESRAQLVESLAELRRVIEQHQQTDAAAIFEDR